MGVIATWLIIVCALIAAAHAAIARFREYTTSTSPKTSPRSSTTSPQPDNGRSKASAQKRAEFEAAVADAVTDGIPHWKAYSDAVETFRGR